MGLRPLCRQNSGHVNKSSWCRSNLSEPIWTFMMGGNRAEITLSSSWVKPILEFLCLASGCLRVRVSGCLSVFSQLCDNIVKRGSQSSLNFEDEPSRGKCLASPLSRVTLSYSFASQRNSGCNFSPFKTMQTLKVSVQYRITRTH